MLRAGRLVVAVIGVVEGAYFLFVALYALLYLFSGELGGLLPGVAFAILGATALGGAAGTLAHRRWGSWLIALASGLIFTYSALTAGAELWWVGAWGVATILSTAYAVALRRSSAQAGP